MFKHAIVRRPAEALADGLRNEDLGTPDYHRALEQHTDYIDALKECNLNVRVLPAKPDYPDSVFIEDVALLTPHCAIITHPGAPTRRGETNGIEKVLREFYDDIYEIRPPATLEAGDVMMAGDHCFIGLSERTNREGAEQLMTILKKVGLSCVTIEIQNILHLKTGVSYLEDNTMLVAPEFSGSPLFDSYRSIEVPAEERYAANCIWINETVLVPEGYPITKQKIKEAGYNRIRTVDTSEFRKLDGGLSCLSLRF